MHPYIFPDTCRGKSCWRTPCQRLNIVRTWLKLRTCSELDRDEPGLVTHFSKHFSVPFCGNDESRGHMDQDTSYIHELLHTQQRHFGPDGIHECFFFCGHICAAVYKRPDSNYKLATHTGRGRRRLEKVGHFLGVQEKLNNHI